ncbi:MAG TPA: glycosyltransferase family 61 protein [Thermoanaerobaculia bacterium]|nr:glycosyltransferase family 61 protein [Thermoanaerobaculia bacterium]
MAQRLALARSFREDGEARLHARLACRPFRRPDPLWTNPRVAVEETTFHCPSAVAAERLRPRFDGRNLYRTPPPCEVAELPDALAGADGLLARPGRLFVFSPESGVSENLAYLAASRPLALGLEQSSLALAGLGSLTCTPEVYYELHAPADGEARAGLRSLYEASRRRAAGRADLARARPRRSRHAKLASLVVKRGYVYYYHLTHALPLLCLLRPLLAADPEIELLTCGAFDEHLALLGVAPRRLIRYDPQTLYQAGRLYAATPPPFLAPPRELLQRVRAAFTAGLPRRPPCAVLVRRTPAQRTAFRNRVCERLGLNARVDVCLLENHDELLAALRRAFPEWEWVDFDSDRLPAAEQVALFARARLVVGAHGSGLANLLFAPPGARVLELMPQRSFFPLFWHLAAALGQVYGVHIVPGVSKYDSFAVPPAEMVGAVRTLLAHPG